MLTHFSVLLVNTGTLKYRALCFYTNLTYRLKCTLVPCLLHTYFLLSKAGPREFTNNFLSECTVVRFSHFLMTPCCFLNSSFPGKMNTLWNVTFSALMLRCLLLSLQQLSQSFWILAMWLYHDRILELWPFKESLAWFTSFPTTQDDPGIQRNPHCTSN